MNLSLGDVDSSAQSVSPNGLSYSLNAHVLLQGDAIRERAQRVCSMAALSAATTVSQRWAEEDVVHVSE